MYYIDRVNCFHQKTKTSINQLKTPSLNRKLIKHIFYFLRIALKLARFESEKEARFIKAGEKTNTNKTGLRRKATQSSVTNKWQLFVE